MINRGHAFLIGVRIVHGHQTIKASLTNIKTLSQEQIYTYFAKRTGNFLFLSIFFVFVSKNNSKL